MVGTPDKQALTRLREGLERLAEHDGTGPAHANILAFAAELGELGDGIGVTVDLAAQTTLGQAMVVLRPREGPPATLSMLTARELEVAQLVAKGLRNKEIAGALGISLGTIKDHVHRILSKAELETRTELAAVWHDG